MKNALFALLVVALISILSGFLQSAYAVTFLDPGPTYLQFSDSPFSTIDFSGGYFHLEDFEDGSLNTPGASLLMGGGIAPPTPDTDSVDADDGVIDGNGNGGRTQTAAGSVIAFGFDSSVLGNYPTHVGIVWTDVGIAPVFGTDQVIIEGFDLSGVSIGTLGPIAVGIPPEKGETAEDRFFGIIHDGGISKISITSLTSGDWEVDHLQYGFVPTQVIGGEMIPIDKTVLLLAGAQSFSWMIPVVLSVLGIGLFVVSRKSENP